MERGSTTSDVQAMSPPRVDETIRIASHVFHERVSSQRKRFAVFLRFEATTAQCRQRRVRE